MVDLQHGQQFLVIEFAGRIEQDLHLLTKSLVTLCDGVEQITDGHNVTHFQGVLLVHQELHHHFQGCPLSLEHTGSCDQCLHECRAERIDQSEHLSVVFIRQERVHHLFANMRSFLEGGAQFLPCRFALGLQYTLVGNHREVAVFELDNRKPTLGPVDRIVEVQLLGAGHRIADELAEVSLTSYETDQWNWSIRVLRFDQLHQLLRLLVDEAHIRRMAGQPEDQFVQEEDNPIVTQCLSVLANHRQALVQIQIRLILAGCDIVVAAEVRFDQVAH